MTSLDKWRGATGGEGADNMTREGATDGGRESWQRRTGRGRGNGQKDNGY